MVAKAMQVVPLAVFTRQVRLPWRYHWNLPVPPKARPLGGFGAMVSLTGSDAGDDATVAGGLDEAIGAFMDGGGWLLVVPEPVTGSPLTVPGASLREGVGATAPAGRPSRSALPESELLEESVE